MSGVGIRIQMDQRGRVVIPAEFRAQMGINTGDEVVMFMEEGTLTVMPPQKALEHARRLIRKYIPEGTSLADELIRERREEARDE